MRLLSLIVSLVVSGQLHAGSTYPQNPDTNLTPGSYCQHPDSYRYPEHIKYCKRNVNKNEKNQIIRDYNEKLGYRIDMRDRNQFKIDHLIPLCMGGSNSSDNLWPQHVSVYTITDPLEGLACEKMAQGRLLQKHAVELLMHAKMHLQDAPQVQAELESL